MNFPLCLRRCRRRRRRANDDKILHPAAVAVVVAAVRLQITVACSREGLLPSQPLFTKIFHWVSLMNAAC